MVMGIQYLLEKSNTRGRREGEEKGGTEVPLGSAGKAGTNQGNSWDWQRWDDFMVKGMRYL